jgi:hypothetical protein
LATARIVITFLLYTNTCKKGICKIASEVLVLRSRRFFPVLN